MTPAEIASYIGAAAWLPQIVYFLNWASKTRIQFYPANQCEIGFTLLGPIFNVRTALYSSKDIIIENLEAQLIREDGTSYDFSWAGITETFSQILNQSGNQTIQRDYSPLIFRLTPLSTLEYFIRFQQKNFLEKKIEIVSNLLKKDGDLKIEGNYCIDKLIDSDEFKAFEIFLKDFFWFIPGKYKFLFNIKASTKIKLIKNEYEFNLDDTNIKILRQNLSLVKDAVKNIIEPKNFPQPFFSWVMPINKKL